MYKMNKIDKSSLKENGQKFHVFLQVKQITSKNKAFYYYFFGIIFNPSSHPAHPILAFCYVSSNA